ncbi:MAG: STAS domain-containing protein [Chitinispirillia bacterium]
MEDFFTQDQFEELLKDYTDKSGSNKSYLPEGKVLSKKCFSITISNRSLGVDNAQKLLHDLRNLVDNVNMHIIINLKECSYLSSLAIGKITQLAVERKKKGLRVAFSEAGKNIIDILKLTSLDHLVEIYPTTEEAQRIFDNNLPFPLES